MRKLKLDDPVDAIPVHAACGVFGVLSVAFCRPDCGYLQRRGGMPFHGNFCAADHQILKQLLAQTWGVITQVWWTMSNSLVLWGFFALSECYISLEDETVAEIHEFTQQLSVSEPGHDRFQALSCIVNRSPVAIKIFASHGWKDGQFADDRDRAPSNMLRICQMLTKARVDKLQSALEIKNRPCVRSIARFCCVIPAMNRCMQLRLRIVPSSELSGLGPTGIDGGHLLRRAQELILSIDTRAKAKSKASNEALDNHVRELTSLVRSQDQVLQRLVRQQYQWAPSRTSPMPEVDEGKSLSLQQERDSCQDRSAKSPRGRAVLGCPHSSGGSTGSASGGFYLNSASTASDNGYTSTGSSHDASPPSSCLAVPPDTVGRPRSSRWNPEDDGRYFLNEVTLQLMEVVQNQQRLSTVMHPAAGDAPAAGESSGAANSQGSLTRNERV